MKRNTQGQRMEKGQGGPQGVEMSSVKQGYCDPWGTYHEIGERIESGELIHEVQAIHRNPEDFEDGDLRNRIYEYDYYKLERIPLTLLDTEEWDVDPERVLEIVERVKNSGTAFPPILFSPENGSIIDGIHRANAARKLDQSEVLAWVGVPPRIPCEDWEED